MFVRILTLKGVSVEAAAGCLLRLLEARGCVVTRNDTGDELECFGLIKSSWLIQCSSEMTLVQVDDTVELRIKLHTMISVVGGMLGVLSLITSVPISISSNPMAGISIQLILIPWLLFSLLYIQVGRGVIHELDVIVDEIYKRFDVSSKSGS